MFQFNMGGFKRFPISVVGQTLFTPQSKNELQPKCLSFFSNQAHVLNHPKSEVVKKDGYSFLARWTLTPEGRSVDFHFIEAGANLSRRKPS